MSSFTPSVSDSSTSDLRSTAMHLPIDDPSSNVEDLVEQLQTCSLSDLRQAQQCHRRALKALTGDQYEGLSSNTRRRLIERLRTHLTALDRAREELEASPSNTDDVSQETGAWAWLPDLW